MITPHRVLSGNSTRPHYPATAAPNVAQVAEKIPPFPPIASELFTNILQLIYNACSFVTVSYQGRIRNKRGVYRIVHETTQRFRPGCWLR